jgi:hypothetical protein
MARDLERRRSGGGTLAKLDDALLVVVAVIAVLVVLKIVGLVVGTVFFVLKLVVGAAIVYALLRLFLRGRRSP